MKGAGVKWAAGCLAALMLLTAAAALPTPLHALDTSLVARLALQPGEPGWDIALWITGLGDGTAVLAAMAATSLMLLRGGEARVLAPLWGGFVLARMITDGLKLSLARPRPEMSGATELIVQAGGYSFPSGHATSATFLYGFLALLILGGRTCFGWRAATAAALGLVALAIAGSRVALGVHYPSDVIGGLLSGGFALAVAAIRLGRGTPRSRTLNRPV